MTFDELKAMIDDISDDQVEDKLGTAEYGLEQLRETYAKPVEMTQEQKEIILTMKEQGDSGFNLVTHIEFYAFNRDDLMRAWLNTDVIKVVDE